MQDYENTRVIWVQHNMGYPCQTCCSKDAELLELAATQRNELQAAVTELQAVPHPARSPTPVDAVGSGVSLTTCIMVAVVVSAVSNVLLLLAVNRKHKKPEDPAAWPASTTA